MAAENLRSASNETLVITGLDLVVHHTLNCYGLVLLIAFVGFAGAQSIISAQTDADFVNADARGPGGKPLPVTKKKKSAQAEPKNLGPDFGPLARRAFQALSICLTLTFVGNAITVATHTLLTVTWPFRGGENGWWAPHCVSIYIISASSLYLYLSLTLFEWTRAPTLAHLLVWSLGFLGELLLFVCKVVKVLMWDASPRPESLERTAAIDAYQTTELALALTRLVILFGLCSTFCSVWAAQRQCFRRKPEDDDSQSDTDEATPLLNGNGHANGNGHHHQAPAYNAPHNGQNENRRQVPNGNATRNPNGAIEGYVSRDEEAAFYRPEKLPQKNWWEYLRGYSLFFQYLWPRDSLWLQFIVLVCFTLLLLQRVTNVWVPIQIAKVTDYLNGVTPHRTPETPFPLLVLLTLIFLRVVQGTSGLIGSLRNLLWIPVSQYSYKALTTAAFEHVHSLSLDFHISKRTGEVLSALNKGASINSFLEVVTFNVFPMILDLIVAIYYFYVAFGGLYATIVGVNTFWYLYLTIRMAQTRTGERRKMTNADREEEAVKNDSIISYETVKYFNAEEYEFKRYKRAIKTFQDAEARVLWGTQLMYIWQNMVFSSGLCVSIMIGGWQAWYGYLRVGQFLALYAYLTQLQGPLNFFASFYRTTQQAMISGERLLELFKIQPTVVDGPHVEPLPRCDGHIRWKNVNFAYDTRRPALRNLDFECTPGTTTAFVGESGGGKSTLFRLMFRYYDCTDGSIEIDGHDVRDLTIDSVRRYIGVVPQDTNMFNETLMYNLKYANPDVSDEEVYAACRAASIHDRIMSFPDKYETKVGDRGVRLSGGERQRVAIARTMLKNPKIIMLDEATSALDSQTEQQIQDRLSSLSQGRTLLIIAHRLSTITHADQILVLHQGAIVERGTHEELLELKGRYAAMWEKQIRAERAAEQARLASRKAHRLMKRANISTAPHGHKEVDAQSDGYNSMASSAILNGANAAHGSKPQSPVEDSSSGSDTDSTHTANGDFDHCLELQRERERELQRERDQQRERERERERERQRERERERDRERRR